MGNFNIDIRGVGAHHNKLVPTDANRMAARFVKELKIAGHTIDRATITCGSRTEDLLDADAYLATCEADDVIEQSHRDDEAKAAAGSKKP